MTAHRDRDRLIRIFLSEGEELLSDSVYDAVRAEIDQTRQRAWFGPWRTPIMSKIVPLGLGAAAVVLALVVGSQLFSSPDGGTGGLGEEPTATPTPTAEPTATPSPVAELPSWYSNGEADGAGILAVGSHTTLRFSPAFTYRVPEGWVNPGDSSGYFELFQDTPPNQAQFGRTEGLAETILMGVHPSPYFTCESLENNAGATAADMVAAASANEVLAVSDPVDVAIGGLTGKQFDVRRNPDWTGTCPEDSGLPAGADPEDERGRVILLDVPDRGVLAIILYSMHSAEHEAFLSGAMPILESFEFTQ